jgi:hypothetical protein
VVVKSITLRPPLLSPLLSVALPAYLSRKTSLSWMQVKMNIIPATVTPKELAEATGWSERYIREQARSVRSTMVWTPSGEAAEAETSEAREIAGGAA